MPQAPPPAPPTPPTPPASAASDRRGGSRRLPLAVCAALVTTLLAVAVLAPLPFVVTRPGLTADLLGERGGRPVIAISGAPVSETRGELRITTIAATTPGSDIRLLDVLGSYVDRDEAVLPQESVYPVGDTTREIRRYNARRMRRSQDAAVAAALGHLGLAHRGIDVGLNLPGVGGPSAGLLFALGVVNKLDGDGEGGDLTGGRVIAGTGTITAAGTVGPVGGVPLKARAAWRDGATVFLLPREECADAAVNAPEGLRLVPVTTLGGAVKALRSLDAGRPVPTC